ncbi:T-cell-specific surface glycoprotein CD28 isoform X2 [Rhineura floridana]|nr:T-cell-specific surface glycoprotein CD28 isoform X2 [Rhineura floridana]XP_061468856.1 T-cell-specific surface glycoprotein CD28 isoform X2 [Rhineura floridana]XP_061468857.1 T-cell-specific surface glycoprotein CD28 isoform X2 [Rhineura floridana]XP_061468858.1 T-cell-specific surface glycoprotein CD28 isoform X2 [Rhineura floridana]
MILWVLTAFAMIQLASLTEKKISVQQRLLHTAGNKSATIFCNYTSKSNEITSFKVLLRKGIERAEVCSVYWDSTRNITKYNKSMEFSCQVTVNKQEKEVIFNLQNLHVNQTDIYTCKIEILNPAPYEWSESLGTLVHVIAPESQCHPGPEFMGVAAAIAVLVCYSILMTAAFCHCWLKTKKNKIIRNDYFNMTPWQSNGPKKRHQPPGVPARNYTAYRSWEP